MAAITGIYNILKEPVNIELFNKVIKALEEIPVDNVQTWQKDYLLFLCHNQWITPESVGEQNPLYVNDKKIVITADAIIDNRNEIFERLQVSRFIRETITDTELILLAYEKWGKESPNYLVGDFSFMIWDENQQILFGARDFSGARTLYYYKDQSRFAFCTTIEPLFELPNVEKKLNEEWLAEFLAIPTMVESTDVNHTVYKNIYQLPPAHTITIEKGNIHLHRYWKLSLDRELKLKSDQEYEEAFHEVFQRSVSEKLRTHGKVGSHLSGGLDSGTVVSFAAKALQKENKLLHTYSYIPEDDFFDWTPKYYLADERPFIKETVQFIGNIKDHYLNFTGKDPFTEVDDFLNLMEMPYKFFENAFWLKGINEHASKQGVKILLNGSRGNHSISWGSRSLSIDYYSSLLRKLRILRLNKELESYCTNFCTGKKVMLPIVARNAFPDLYKMLARRNETDYQFPSFINPDFAKRTKVFIRLLENDFDISGTSSGDFTQYRRKHYNQLYFWNKSGTATTKLSLRYSLWDRDPTNDLRVIQFCLSIPEEQYVKNGMERSFLRRATKNILPDKVRLNHQIRGIQGADTVHRMRSCWSAFVEELKRLSNDSMMTEFVNRDVIQNGIDYIGKDHNPNIIFSDQFKILIRSLILYRFLKYLY
ncbi:asparagine synthase-related protein [Bacillus dakarensis]|uniref:asparagine synthase-related protein n=1 Tax=Robertmurraya dakarensis TaxID=1926278 RepID=UPI000980C43B|nr:asparagine synthase-related protein [Bacillus dakarensis]